ncbi:hypothetical protein Ade02nite_15130 [Paractinoplanes deccanensis]|uniref:Uncharacterized protein n=1 Tax=Paractinoplanes deccanensis TaxID=113561 RepID=A0ABQ3XYQ7_9ACTN|nr:hypothetical protein [Actinoplanes deccanensis]GID72872.1 hypothetical protein Ade02nite_15130 [Actinoplanes deccanensis]
MATPDLVLGTPACRPATLPLNPFVSNRYHFGMLLGVADLDTEQGYHRGKGWLHNAWLHGPGAVWGLRAEVTPANNEVVVHPGLALDGNGRELHVGERLCVDFGRWYAERRPAGLDVTEEPDGSIRFTAHVRLCARPCLDRPVPSVSEPCEGSDLGTAYSRTVEQAQPELAGGPAPAVAAPPYPRLRQLAGQLEMTDQDVRDAAAAIDAAADRPAEILRALRRLAALDTVALEPEGGAGELYPVAGDGCVVLAQIEAHLVPDGDRWTVAADTTVDNAVRPAHVRTSALQELLFAQPAAPPQARTGAAPDGEPPRARDAGLTGSRLRILFTRPLLAATVTPGAFTVTVLRADGWNRVAVTGAEADEDGTAVTLTLRSAPRTRPIRVVAAGAGPTPILGADGLPLSGAEADRAAVPSGADAALLIGADGAPPE